MEIDAAKRSCRLLLAASQPQTSVGVAARTCRVKCLPGALRREAC
jgi:hypothetical protein